jgi:hypothetical protein
MSAALAKAASASPSGTATPMAGSAPPALPERNLDRLGAARGLARGSLPEKVRLTDCLISTPLRRV